MTRLFLLCLGALLFAACGDDGTLQVDCDPAHFDCTPIVTPPTCDPNKFDCTTIGEPAWIPSKDDLRAIGAVFPGDADWNELSWSSDVHEGISALQNGGITWIAEGLLDRMFCKPPSPDFPANEPYQYTQCQVESYDVEGAQTVAWGQDFDENLAEITKNEYFCVTGANWGRESHAVPAAVVLPRFTHVWRWHEGALTRFAPPEDRLNWLCLATPYGAAWLPADNAASNVPLDARFHRGGTGEFRTTCHKSVSWIAYTRTGGPEPTAYTVGTLEDQYVPVDDCEPWGSQVVK